MKSLTMVDVSLIDLTPDQNQRWNNDQDDQELVKSIEANGIIEPLALAPNKERYVVIAGVRRLCAARTVKLDVIPAIIYDVGVDDATVLGLHENLFRKNPNPVELARQLRHLEKEYGWTRRSIAQKVGKSEPWVSQRLDVLNYPPTLLAALESGQLTSSQAREISRIPDEDSINRIVRQTIDSGASVRVIIQWVKDEVSRLEAEKKASTAGAPTSPGGTGDAGETSCFACGSPVKANETVAVRLCKQCHVVLGHDK